ncbi:glycoside hydrolase family 3 protein [Butyriboletus roseoflavus]|nr:glycoside hydrolase family 3 protein [Butyriboletus roseoflavus]
MVALTDADKREIGQHFVFGFHGHEISENAKTLIRDYHVGNIILMKRNVQSIKQVHGLVKSLQQFAKDCGHTRPLMIGIDQENGLVSAFSSTHRYTAGTQFPGAMALAATGDPGIAKLCSLGTAREMKLAGINWAYSPVADVNSDHRNPVIGVRSFGDDPREVAKYAIAVSSGLAQGGVAPSAKHFPGHGDTHVDSHLALPVIKKSDSELHETELVPFRALIEAGIATIMTGHMALPLVVGEADSETPCSCSRTVTTELLRDRLGFKGVVVTDCLEMDAVAAKYTSQKGAVLSLQAGADVVMICHTMELQRGAIEETYRAVEQEALSLVALRESGTRVDELKARFAGTWESVVAELDERRLAEIVEVNGKLSERAYGASTCVIQGPLPEVGPGPVLVLTPETESVNKAVDDDTEKNTAGPPYISLTGSVQTRRKGAVHVVYSPLPGPEEDVPAEVLRALRQAECPALLIFVTRNADRSAWQTTYLRKLRKHIPEETAVVVLASCGPYDLVDARDVEYACVGSFEYTPAALDGAAAVILGERAARGRVPVRWSRG